MSGSNSSGSLPASFRCSFRSRCTTRTRLSQVGYRGAAHPRSGRHRHCGAAFGSTTWTSSSTGRSSTPCSARSSPRSTSPWSPSREAVVGLGRGLGVQVAATVVAAALFQPLRPRPARRGPAVLRRPGPAVRGADPARRLLEHAPAPETSCRAWSSRWRDALRLPYAAIEFARADGSLTAAAARRRRAASRCVPDGVPGRGDRAARRSRRARRRGLRRRRPPAAGRPGPPGRRGRARRPASPRPAAVPRGAGHRPRGGAPPAAP